MNNKKENLIYGRNPVKEALRSKRVKLIYLANGFTNNEILSMIGEAGVQINYISNKELDNMCGGVHQGVAAVIKDYEYYSLDAIIAKSKKQEKPDRKSVV